MRFQCIKNLANFTRLTTAEYRKTAKRENRRADATRNRHREKPLFGGGVS